MLNSMSIMDMMVMALAILGFGGMLIGTSVYVLRMIYKEMKEMVKERKGEA